VFNIISASQCLVLDPNSYYQRLVREILRFSCPRNLEIAFATSVDQSLLFIKEVSVSFIVMEADLPLAEALRFIKTVRRGKAKFNFDITTPIFAYADNFSPHEIFLLRDAGIHGLMVRPFSAAAFSKCLNSVANRKFIETITYCGPDRRRKKLLDCLHKRREDDRRAELATSLAAAKAEEELLWKAAAEDQAKLDAALKKAEAAAEVEAARKKAEAEAEVEAARKKAEAEASAAVEAASKVDLSAMTQEELARHLRNQKK
jgi:hypothetical protein